MQSSDAIGARHLKENKNGINKVVNINISGQLMKQLVVLVTHNNKMSVTFIGSMKDIRVFISINFI